MPKLVSYDLYCPRCQNKASTANPCFIRYSVRRLQLPIFLCGECRTIYIDKLIICHAINEWYRSGLCEKNITLRRLYREFLREIERMVDTYFVPKLGYKKINFLKHPQKSDP